MKVGTDGVLLGAWASVDNANRILDIGTGTGLIALMMAQRSHAVIDGIELDDSAARQASENVSESPWSERIKIHISSLQHFYPIDTKYDLIVSNPPYFSDFSKNTDSHRFLARQNHTLTPSDLIKGAIRLMKNTGKLALIYPANAIDLLFDKTSANGLTPNRITGVIPKPGVKVKRLLVEFVKGKSKTTYDELVIEKSGRHQYSKEYKKLTSDFYLTC